MTWTEHTPVMSLRTCPVCSDLAVPMGWAAGLGSWAGQLDWAAGLGSWAGQLGWAAGLGSWAGQLGVR